MADTSRQGSLDGGVDIRRACDHCRFRKVRCDRETPCSNCKITKRDCQYTSQRRAPDPTATMQKMRIVQQYERKMDNVESHLEGIEKMLHDITATLKQSNISSPAISENEARTTRSSDDTESGTMCQELLDDEETENFEGESSMAAHTVMASEFLEQVVTGSTLGPKLNGDIQNALSSLQQMVRMQKGKGALRGSRLAHQKQMPKGGYAQLPLPPVDLVLEILREIKAVAHLTFRVTCTFITIDYFIDSCRKVYFATEDYSITTFIIANTGLYHLMQEKSIFNHAKKDEYLKYHYICRDNIETALGNLPLLLPATKDSIEALLLGVTYAIEIAKFSLAWQLNCSAAVLCQNLGWHRLKPSDLEPIDPRLSIFWFCYNLDKGLSLSLGRASAMQDWDISTPAHFGNIQNVEPWGGLLTSWIKGGSLLGEIYEKLYSHRALSRPPSERIQNACILIEKFKVQAAEMLELMRNNTVVADSGVESNERWFHTMTLEIVATSARVGQYASMTLIYRAIPSAPGVPSAFSNDCIEAARMAFKCHEECMELTLNKGYAIAGYLHWTVLYSPFTPFIVLFCHVIETSNLDDLKRLCNFTESLQPVTFISQAIEKLYGVCKALYQVAKLYVEAKSRQQEDEDMNMVGNDFDVYLSQLGFISQYQAFANAHNTGSQASVANQAQELSEWFSGNTSIMGLMEQDFLESCPFS